MRRGRHGALRGFVVAALSLLVAFVLVLSPLRSSQGAPGAAGKKIAKIADAAVEASAADAVEPLTVASTDAGIPKEKPKDAADDDAFKTVPMGKGLPVQVSTAVRFLELKSFDDNKGEFEAVLDIRLQWYDLRLRYPKSEAARGYKELRGKKADAQLEKMWVPEVEARNRVESSGATSRRLRIYEDGLVETITRETAKYKVHIESERFPFDRQKLVVDLAVREATTDEVVLAFDKDDLSFSRVQRGAKLDGWDLGIVDLRGDEIAGWNGDRYSRVDVTLLVDRLATSSLAPIFIPLVASLLIPLLAIWMNRATKEGFEVPAFELANMGIGGLFSVIALSFAIYSAYGIVAGNDNTVTRLFGLNYVSLALALGIVVLFYRYNVLTRLFGPYVQEQAFRFLAWALPVLSVAVSVAFLLVAAV